MEDSIGSNELPLEIKLSVGEGGNDDDDDDEDEEEEEEEGDENGVDGASIEPNPSTSVADVTNGSTAAANGSDLTATKFELTK